MTSQLIRSIKTGAKKLSLNATIIVSLSAAFLSPVKAEIILVIDPSHQLHRHYVMSATNVDDISDYLKIMVASFGFSGGGCASFQSINHPVHGTMHGCGVGWYAVPGNSATEFMFFEAYGPLNPVCINQTMDLDTGLCEDDQEIVPEPTIGCPVQNKSLVGNPCDPATGNKLQQEIDFTSSSSMLSVNRTYNSQSAVDIGFGEGWTSNLFKRMNINPGNQIIYRHNSGKSETFNLNSGVWTTDEDSNLLLAQDTGYTVTQNSGTVEQFDSSGKLLSITSSNGMTTSYVYNANGQLTSVTDPFGKSITISWNYRNIVSIVDTYGGTYSYSFDGDNNLKSVSYPDGGSRIYHYENSSYPSHLTGITDENGDRYATFVYDSQGRAISTEHADVGNGVQEKFSIDYTQ